MRDRQGTHIASINTGRTAQQGPPTGDMQTPGGNYDMNFTPLLPSQLLMGSPFQSNSPATFSPAQFQNFSNFSANANHFTPANPGNQMGGHMQTQQPLSPGMFQNMVSPTGLGSPSPFGGPQGFGGYGGMNHGYGNGMQMSPGMVGTSRTVYLGNIPTDTSAEEILSHVRSGQIESVRLLPDKNCAFISFIDGSAAVHFHSDAILKKLSIRGQDIKIGWGKPSQVPSSVALAIQQSGASRNVYLGNLPAETTEEELREDLGKFGPLDTVKLVRDKAIGFVHFLSIGHAIKAVTQLPQDSKWQPPRRVFYGKDRCAYVSKTQQQNAAQYLGIAPGYAHVLNNTDRDMISQTLAQQSVAAAAVATAAGGVNNLGNRTVYLGNIHPETTAEEICNVVRGGLLHHIRYIPDKHICFVTFIDPTAAASFYALSNVQGLMIHNRRLKIGWGKHSGALPPAIALAVSGGASRNVYIGNIDETWSEERLRKDFAEFGEIELVNALREKNCAFVNYTNIANAIKAIEAIRGKDDYKRFKINFGKDRCGNPPRQNNHNHQNIQNQLQQGQMQMGQDSFTSPMGNGSFQPGRMSGAGSSASPANSGYSHAPGALPNHMANGSYHSMHGHSPSSAGNGGSNSALNTYLDQLSLQSPQQSELYPSSQSYNPKAQSLAHISHSAAPSINHSGLDVPQQQQFSSHGLSNSFSHQANNAAPTVGGMLAPSSLNPKGQHNRAISLPAFSQGPDSQPQNHQQQRQQPHHTGLAGLGGGLGSGIGGLGNGMGYGLAITGESGLSRWAEEEA
ncbi:MAG: hypothetical protein M1828_006779 [Chrysothrix sp. TS-e1954]|nr:MAG: hypothetical protein M1828_006779 [Chrysothrix sp. TS-e1954]